jgi:DNA-binding transcriptional regulator GbsR (MarR family)
VDIGAQLGEDNTPKPGSSAANRKPIQTYEDLADAPNGRLITLSELARVMGRSTRAISFMLKRLERKSGSPLLIDIGSAKPRFAVTAGALKKMLSIAYQVRPGAVEELTKRTEELSALLDKAVTALNELNDQLNDQATYLNEITDRVDALYDICEIHDRTLQAIRTEKTS